jgi:hypothetical protein
MEENEIERRMNMGVVQRLWEQYKSLQTLRKLLFIRRNRDVYISNVTRDQPMTTRRYWQKLLDIGVIP